METVIDPTEATVDTAQQTEGNESVNTNDETTNDYWTEDTHSEQPPELGEEASQTDTDTDTDGGDEDSQTSAEAAEYVTKGLGKFDKPMVIKYKGKIYDIDDKDQARDLMERGMAATAKMQELAELKRQLLKERNPDISDNEIDQISAVDEVEEVAKSIINSPYADDFKQTVSQLPDDIVGALRADPMMLKGLAADVESGLAQKIIPLAGRYMDLDGMSFQEAYFRGGQEVQQSSQPNKLDKLMSEPRTSHPQPPEEKDIWQISDDEFRSLMASERT